MGNWYTPGAAISLSLGYVCLIPQLHPWHSLLSSIAVPVCPHFPLLRQFSKHREISIVQILKYKNIFIFPPKIWESANLVPQTKSGPLPVFENKFLLENIPLHIVCGCFHITKTESNSYDRDQLAHKFLNIYYSGLCRKSVLTPALENKLWLILGWRCR